MYVLANRAYNEKIKVYQNIILIHHDVLILALLQLDKHSIFTIVT